MRSLIVLVSLAVLSAPTIAGFPPIKFKASRAEIAARCEALGVNGLGQGLGAPAGAYGCRNLATGNLVECDEQGVCTSYHGDPRVKRLNLRGLPA